MDVYLFNLIHGWAGSWTGLDILMVFFAQYFGYIMFLGALVFLFLGKGEKRRQNQLMIFSALISALISRGIITELIKFFYDRARPFVFYNFEPLISHASSNSLPSGHMAFWWAAAAAVYFYNKKLALMLAVGSLLVGIARIYVGVHWPSDILGGAVIGVVVGWLTSWYVENKWRERA